MVSSATSVLDAGRRVLVVGRVPTLRLACHCSVVLVGPRIVGGVRLVGVGIASAVLVAGAVVVLVVTVTTLG